MIELTEENYYCVDSVAGEEYIGITATVRDYRDDDYLQKEKRIVECYEIIKIETKTFVLDFDKMEVYATGIFMAAAEKYCNCKWVDLEKMVEDLHPQNHPHPGKIGWLS